MKFCVMVYVDGFVIMTHDYKYGDGVIELHIQC
jgi:hypothetical protein